MAAHEPVSRLSVGRPFKRCFVGKSILVHTSIRSLSAGGGFVNDASYLMCLNCAEMISCKCSQSGHLARQSRVEMDALVLRLGKGLILVSCLADILGRI